MDFYAFNKEVRTKRHEQEVIVYRVVSLIELSTEIDL